MTPQVAALLHLAACALGFWGWWVFCMRYEHVPALGMLANAHGPTHVQRHRGRVLIAGAGVPAPAALRFEVKKEGWLDRLGKRLGLSVEGQMGHADFDEAYYLMCDDVVTLAALRGDRELRDALLELVVGPVPPGFALVHLRCADGLLYAQYRNTRWLRDVDPAVLFGGLQLRLQRIARHLPARGGDPAPADARRRAYYIGMSVSTGLLMVGGLGGAFLAQTGLPQVSNRHALWFVAAVLAIGAFAWGVRWLWARLGRTSRMHLALLQALFLGLPGAWVCAAIVVRDVDVGLDLFEPRDREGIVVGHRLDRNRRIPDRVHLDVRLVDRRGDRVYGDGSVTLRLSLSEAQRAGAMGPVRLLEHRGALGLRWIADVERDDAMWREMEAAARDAD